MVHRSIFFGALLGLFLFTNCQFEKKQNTAEQFKYELRTRVLLDSILATSIDLEEEIRTIPGNTSEIELEGHPHKMVSFQANG